MLQRVPTQWRTLLSHTPAGLGPGMRFHPTECFIGTQPPPRGEYPVLLVCRDGIIPSHPFMGQSRPVPNFSRLEKGRHGSKPLGGVLLVSSDSRGNGP